MRSLPPPRVLLLLAAVLIGLVGASRTWKDKSKPVRAALERRYTEMADAYRRRDPSGVLNLRRPDVFSVSPSGDTADANGMRGYTEASFAQVETTLALEWTLGVIEVHGDTAAAEIDQHWRRRQRKAGAVRLADTHAHQRETWIHDPGGWRLWRVDRVVPGVWRVDGRRVDPSKPYDPAAPSFDSK